MADKIAMIRDLDDDAAFEVFARAEQVEVKYDKKNDPYHSIHLKDETGTTWMKAFKSHNLSVRPGDIVRGKAKVNLYQGKKSLKAWGDDLKLAEGSAGAFDAPAPQTGATGPSGGGGAPQQSAPPRQGTMTDEEWLAWARPMLGELTTLYRSQVPSGVLDAQLGEVEAAILGAAQATLVHLSISMEHGNLTPTLGRQAAPERREPSGPLHDDGGFDDDDSIPFSIILIPMILPLLGGLVGLS